MRANMIQKIPLILGGMHHWILSTALKQRFNSYILTYLFCLRLAFNRIISNVLT